MDESRELSLFIINDVKLYKFCSLMDLYTAYNYRDYHKLCFLQTVIIGAKKYCKKFCESECDYKTVFNWESINETCEILWEHYAESYAEIVANYE